MILLRQREFANKENKKKRRTLLENTGDKALKDGNTEIRSVDNHLVSNIGTHKELTATEEGRILGKFDERERVLEQRLKNKEIDYSEYIKLRNKNNRDRHNFVKSWRGGKGQEVNAGRRAVSIGEKKAEELSRRTNPISVLNNSINGKEEALTNFGNGDTYLHKHQMNCNKLEMRHAREQKRFIEHAAEASKAFKSVAGKRKFRSVLNKVFHRG